MNTFSKEEVNAKLGTLEANLVGKLDGVEARLEGRFTAAVERLAATEQYMRMQADRCWDAAESAARSAEAAARSADSAARSSESTKQLLWITSLTTIFSVLAIAVAAYFGSQQSAIAIAQAVTQAYQVGTTDNAAPAQPQSAGQPPAPARNNR